MSRIRSSFDTAAILDRASPASATDNVSPLQALVFGTLGGLGAAIGLGFLLDYLQDAIRSPRDVLGAAGIPPLGRLRYIGVRGWRQRSRQRALLMLHNGRSLAAEGFRSLRASILLNASYRPLRVLVVTSAGPGEGKTCVASNLAIAHAQAGQRVLLVDGDLRRPSLHRLFGVSNDVGLVDALRAAARRLAPRPAGQ